MTLKVYVDWQNNGNFTDLIDDISDDVMTIDWRLGMRQSYQPIADEMTLTMAVRNTDGKYTPENSGSPLSGYILPQRRAKVEFVDGGGTTGMWFGYLEFPEVTWSPGGNSTGKVSAVLHGVGAKTLLESNNVSLQIYDDVTGDEIIKDVLNQTTLPATITDRWVLGVTGKSEIGSTTTLGETADYAVLDEGITTFPVYGDSNPLDAWQVISEVTAAEQGRFFFGRDGRANWWDRTHLLEIVNNSGTVSTTSGSNKPVDLDYTYGTQIANSIRVETHPRQTSSEETLWELDTTIPVDPGATITFEITLRKSSGQFVGAGSLRATPTFSQGSGTVVVNALGGKADVRVTNSSASAPAVLSGLVVTGQPTVQQNDIAVETEDVDSISTYGKRTLTVDLGPVSDYALAKQVGEFELRRRKDAKGEVNWLAFTRQADGSDDAMLLDWPIGTRILVSSTELGHSSEFHVIGEEHGWSPGEAGGVHKGKLYLEPAINDLWILGAAGRSEIGSTTYLA